MRRSLWLLPVALMVALAVPMLLGGRELWPTLAAFPAGQLALMLGLVVVCWNLNAWRLRLLLAGKAGALGQPQALAIVMATEFAICATPGGSGGPVTLFGLLVRRGMPAAQATAAFAADQLTDLIFFLLALCMVALYAASVVIDPRLGWLIGSSIVLLSAGMAMAWLWLRHTSRVLQLSGRWLGHMHLPRRMRFGLARRLLRFRRALIDILRLPRRRLVMIFALCCCHWLLRYSVLYLVLAGLGRTIPWMWTFLIQMLAMAAGQLSMLPGGVGGAELTSTALLMPLIGLSHSAAAVLIWRFVTFYFYLLAGAPVFLLLLHRHFLARKGVLWRR